MHGGGPTDDLVDRSVGPLPLEQFPLVRVLEEGVHAVRHGVAGGLVPRNGEQDDEEREFDLTHGLPVDIGFDQPGDDVIGRAAAPLVGHVVGVAHQLGVGGHVVRLEVRVVGVHDRVGPVEQLLPVRLRHADQIGDGQQRQLHRDVINEIAEVALCCSGNDFAGGDRKPFLELGDCPRREEPRHDFAQPGVLGSVVVDQ
jgi:hypothetical protein